MQSRFVLVAVALFLWWTSATTAAQARPPSLGVASVERFDTAASPAALHQDAGSVDAQRPAISAGQDDTDAGVADMPAVPMTDLRAPDAPATMARPGPYVPAAWAAPDLGVPQRPPSATAAAD